MQIAPEVGTIWIKAKDRVPYTRWIITRMTATEVFMRRCDGWGRRVKGARVIIRPRDAWRGPNPKFILAPAYPRAGIG